ncbi:phage tail protein [Acinetobacter cumulans]|uniref:Phage tail protein n=1 Tax=Acinetobacter cumulans TaxID=2136182 RepID=A0A498D640_9GAMM|nr:phage tail protein [Acinetobacter cumulans]RLL33730.1 phage tail protein [Acinetobacter cumulans]
MKKPDSLRAHILSAVKELQRDPDRMFIHTSNGNIRCTGAKGLSFEYVYELSFVLQDYAGDLDAVMIPLFDWVRVHQSDLLMNLDKSREAFKFETVLLNNNLVDLSLTFQLTERVIVKRQDNGTLDITFPEEPQYEEPLDPQPMQLIDSNTGEILAQWTSTAP